VEHGAPRRRGFLSGRIEAPGSGGGGAGSLATVGTSDIKGVWVTEATAGWLVGWGIVSRSVEARGPMAERVEVITALHTRPGPAYRQGYGGQSTRWAEGEGP
jgi:hypothetical protein